MNEKMPPLDEAEREVIENKATEPAFSGKYDRFFGKGQYICRRCGTPLYDSERKFDAHCGWPAFDEEIKGAVKKHPDADGQRVEISCSNCGAHLGHIFTGEQFTKTDTRHCVNSLSLVFVPDKKTSSGSK